MLFSVINLMRAHTQYVSAVVRYLLHTQRMESEEKPKWILHCVSGQRIIHVIASGVIPRKIGTETIFSVLAWHLFFLLLLFLFNSRTLSWFSFANEAKTLRRISNIVRVSNTVNNMIFSRAFFPCRKKRTRENTHTHAVYGCENAFAVCVCAYRNVCLCVDILYVHNMAKDSRQLGEYYTHSPCIYVYTMPFPLLLSRLYVMPN